MVVGTGDELAKMPLLLGEEIDERMDVNANVLSVDVEVVEASLAGKKLAQLKVWERYNVLITRIRRQGWRSRRPAASAWKWATTSAWWVKKAP
jgi:uncharacterized transporter YbjL